MQTVAAAAPCTVAFGAFDTASPGDFTMVNSLEQQMHRHLAIVHWYQQWGPNADWNGLHMTDFSNTVQHGSVPMITWEPLDGSLPGAANSFPLRQISAGTYDAYVDSWAKGLRDYGAPVMLRFAHEMNEPDYPWSAGRNGNTPQDYVAAFRHVHDRFSRAGASNVQWVWAVAGPSSVDQPIRDFYPGDAYVDWLGTDVYNWGTTQSWGSVWQSMAQIMQPSYDLLTALNPSKPIIVSEWASTEFGGDKAAWIRAAGAAIPALFPRVKALVWFNERVDNPENFRLDSSPASIAAAATAFGAGTPYCLTFPYIKAGGPSGSWPGLYHPLAPARVLDTRDPRWAVPSLGAGQVHQLALLGRAGIPATGVAAVTLNVTVTNPRAGGFVTVGPAGGWSASTSTLNFEPGQTVPNLSVAALGANGLVALFNGTPGQVDVVVDVEGWVSDSSTPPGASGHFVPVSPTRVLDTRQLGRRLEAGQTITLPLGGRSLVPAGSSAAALNVTVTEPVADGYLTAYPTGTSRPLASNLNFMPGQTVPNRVFVALDASGSADFYNGSSGPLELVVDLNGAFTGDASSFSAGAYTGLFPIRVLDTRDGTGASLAPVASAGVLTLPIAGRFGVPTAGAAAVVLNVTVVNATRIGFVTVYPEPVRPLASDLNFIASTAVPNLTVTSLGPDGAIRFYNASAGTVDLIADLVGWFSG